MSNPELADAITSIKNSFKEDIKTHFGNVSCNILETEERLAATIIAVEKRVLQTVDAFEEKVQQVLQSELETKLERISSLVEESVTKTNQRCQVLEQTVVHLQLESEAKSHRIASLQIKLNQRNLLLFNMEDQEKTENELLNLVIELFGKTVKVPLHTNDIEYVYRLGIKEESKDRPIMIALFSIKLRNEILRAKGNLKGSKVVIAEDFPKENNQARKEIPAKAVAKTQNRKTNIRIKKI